MIKILIVMAFLISPACIYAVEDAPSNETKPSKHGTRSLSPISDTEARLIRLENRVEDLEQEVDDMKRKPHQR